MLGKHAGEDLEAEVLGVAQAVGTALQDVHFVDQPLDEAEGDLVLGSAIGGGESVPMTLDHVGEAPVGREALPLELGPPVVEILRNAYAPRRRRRLTDLTIQL